MILTSRYMCPDHPGTRVFPYDTAMLRAGALSPENGKSGEPVLLATFNNGRVDTKLGFCFAGMHWSFASRLSEHELAMMYAGLVGVGVSFRTPTHRQPKGKEQLARVIELRLRRARRNKVA